MRATSLFGFAALIGFAVAAHAASSTKDGAFDPRLGAPFEVRERPSLGSDKAPIVVIEFGSYKCAHCEAFHQRVFPTLNENYIKTGKVQWFMVPASDDSADESSRIFAIGRCIAKQGKFWDSLEFLMAISNRPPSFLNDLIEKNTNLDAGEISVCLQQRDARMQVSRDFAEYHALKMLGTPTFIVRKLRADGTRTETIVRGFNPTEYFQRIFDELAKTP